MRCLETSIAARKARQELWIEYLRSVCHEDAVKWRNKCGSMLRRIRRIRETMDRSINAGDAEAIASLSPSMREHRIQTAIEEYSIQTGLDYDQSKSVLDSSVIGERGGTADLSADQRLKRFVETASPAPMLEVETVVSISDPAFAADERLSEQRSYLLQFVVWLFARSLWLVVAAVYLGFVVNKSHLAGIPVLAVSVVGLASFPYPPHSLWRILVLFQILVIAAKIGFQFPWVCDSAEPWTLFTIASQFTKRGEPYCPPVYIISHANRFGLFKLGEITATAVLQLVWTETLVVIALLVHLRSLWLSGRLSLSPHRAREFVSGDARPTKDTYTVRFLLALAVTVLLVTNWTTITATKLVSPSSSLLGEGITRNYFSPFQVLAVTLFVFQIVLDRCLYTLMSHSPSSDGSDDTMARSNTARFGIMISVTLQFCLLLVSMNSRLVVPFFVVYSLYLLLTARQLAFDIRPVGGKSGFLWAPGWWSYYAYRAYLLIPFLDELRQISDWVASPATSLSLFMWFKVEDCIQNLRFVQAEMDSRQALPLLRADRACIGVSAIVGLVAIITGPLVFFSGLNVLREPSPVVAHIPGEASTSLTIFLQSGTLRVPLYSSTQVETEPVSADSAKDDQVLAPLTIMKSADLQRISFPAASDVEFGLSPPLLERLGKVLQQQTNNVTVLAEWNFMRQWSPFTTTLSSIAHVRPETVLHALTNATGGEIRVAGLVPEAVYLDATPTAKIIQDKGMHKDTKLQLSRSNESAWWSLHDPSGGVLCLGERGFGAGSAGGSGGYSISVIGLYIGVVLTVGRFIRLSLQGSSKRIPVEELPSTETVMHLCQGIHIARLFKDSDTEKRLYSDLVKLFRDPNLLIAATGPTAT